MRGSHKKLKDILLNQNYENIVIHFGFRKTLKTIVKHSPSSKLFIFVHGVEALAGTDVFYL